MPYDPGRDLTLRKLQSEVRQLNRELRIHFDEDKFEQLFQLHQHIRERVIKQIRKRGPPPGWEET
jgi:hypothetical protein